MGITGARDAVSSSAAGVVARIREHTTLPAAVGLGVSTGAQARRGRRLRRRRDRRLRLRPPHRRGRHPRRRRRGGPRPHRRPGAGRPPGITATSAQRAGRGAAAIAPGATLSIRAMRIAPRWCRHSCTRRYHTEAAGCSYRTNRAVTRPLPGDDRVAPRAALCRAIGGFRPVLAGYRCPYRFFRGLRAGSPADASVPGGAVIHLLLTRRTCIKSLQSAHKPALVSISPVM